METWRRREAAIALTADTDGSRDGGRRDQVEPGGEDVGIGECGDEDWVRGVFVVIVCCPYENGGAEDADDNVLSKNDTEGLTKGKQFEDIFWEDGVTLCRGEKSDKLGHSIDGVRARRVEPSDRDVSTP